MLRRRDFVAATVVGIAGCTGDSVTSTASGSGGSSSSNGGTGAGSGNGGSGNGSGGTGGRPTPACPPTEDNALGPAYVADAPYRNDLNVLGFPGTKLVIRGTTKNTDCDVIVGALLDIWQANDAGNYDGSALDPDGNPAPDPAYPLRGRLESGADGSYEFTTIWPGFYTGRTRHIHVIISASGYATLTTQIYFEGVPQNATDGLIEPELTIPLTQEADGSLSGVFDIVLAAAP